MILVLILAIGGGVWLMGELYTRLWHLHIGIHLEFRDAYGFEGDSSVLLEAVTNEKKLPLPSVEAAFQISRHLVFVDVENTSVSDMCYKRDIFSVRGYQRITRRLNFKCAHRGYYRIDEAQIIARGLFRNQSMFYTENQNTDFYVYPRQVDTYRLEIPFKRIMGTIVSRQFVYEDPFERKGVREYMQTDAMNRINWKATARTGEMMVNVFDSTSSQEIVILLDVEDETTWKFTQLHEAGIQVASSMAARLLAQDIPVRIYCNGKDQLSKEGIRIPAGAGKRHIHAIYECLARIDLSQAPLPFDDVLRESINDGWGKNCFYLVISKNQRESLRTQIMQLAERGADLLWILPLHKDMEIMARAYGRLEVYRWEVER